MDPTSKSTGVHNQSVLPVGQSSISDIPEELVLDIFYHLSIDDVKKCREVNKKWKRLVNDPIFVHIYVCRNIAFGCDKWTKCFGENAIRDKDRKIERESLPDNILEILNSECPAFPGKKKKVMETHMLVFIPKFINRKPLTLKSLGDLAKQYFPENEDGYRIFWPYMARAIGNNTIDKSGWRLMTTDVLEGSRRISFDDQTKGSTQSQRKTQKQCVADLAKKTLVNYEVPTPLDAAACMLVQYFKDSHTRLFSDDPLTYTRCQERGCDYQVVVGGFASSGLGIFSADYDRVMIGVAALRKF